MHFVIFCFLVIVLQQFCTFLSTEFFKPRKQFELFSSVDPSSACCAAAQFASLSPSHHAVTWLCHFCIPPSLKCSCPAPPRSFCLCPACAVLGTWRACRPSLPPSAIVESACRRHLFPVTHQTVPSGLSLTLRPLLDTPLGVHLASAQTLSAQ